MQNPRVKRKSKANLSKRAETKPGLLSLPSAFHTHPIMGQNQGIVERGWRIIFSYSGIRNAKMCVCASSDQIIIPFSETIK